MFFVLIALAVIAVVVAVLSHRLEREDQQVGAGLTSDKQVGKTANQH